MPQLLLELFSEEIPARMQKRAEEDLARAFGDKLKAHGLEGGAIKTFSSPRRLGLVIDELPAKAADVNEEKKGPRVGAPDQAVQGFLKSAGLKSLGEAEIVEDKKGAFYVARIERAGRATAEIVSEITPEIIRGFPWPKSMRSQSGDLQWVRPLHNVLCVFDGKPVPVTIDGVGNEPVTWGHRFHAPAALPVTNAAEHAAKLRGAKVLIEREERKAIILEQAKKLCAAKGLELVEDIGLLEEVAGLVEWPVVLLGDMDPAFLDLPGEVIRLSMRTHQKYFAVREPQKNKEGGKLAPHFVVVANVDAKDGGTAIAAGNARVLSARLNDARFFWDTDRKLPLDDASRIEKLKKIVFHQKLGSVWDKVERVKALAAELCAVTGADVALVERAADLSKMDLVTETVGEFPELQGQIGRALAEQQPTFSLAEKVAAQRPDEGRSSAPPLERLNAPHPPTPSPQGRGGAREHPSVATAIEDHYRPLGPNDRVPTDPVAVTLALADKLDTLVGFWAIDEKPTGSSDPYALRRAALGFSAIVRARSIRLSLHDVILSHLWRVIASVEVQPLLDLIDWLREFKVHTPRDLQQKGIEDVALSEGRPVLGPYLRREGFADTFGPLVSRLRSIKDQRDEKNWPAGERYKNVVEPLKAAVSERWNELLEWYDASSAFSLRGLVRSIDDCGNEDARKSFVLAEEKFFDFEGPQIVDDLLKFLAERVKVQLREQGKRHDLVDAVFSSQFVNVSGDDDLVRIVARVEALDAFLKTEAGANLLAGYKRAANILAAEEKKGRGLTEADIAAGLDAKLLAEPAEKALFAALEAATPKARAAVEKEDFAAAMGALAALRAPVDAFFEKVLVNADDPMLRRNRLLLLSRLREALSAVADFSKIEG